MSDTQDPAKQDPAMQHNPPPQPAPDAAETPETEEALLQKIVEYKNIAVRATADYRNLQKETEQKISDMRKFATSQLLQDLCPLVDYFDSAFKAIPLEQQSQPWIQGVKHIQSYLMQILKQYDVERMETVGKPFDPHLHEAVGEEESDDKDQIVLKETQAGFMMHGKVIRHAKVIVSKPKSN